MGVAWGGGRRAETEPAEGGGRTRRLRGGYAAVTRWPVARGDAGAAARRAAWASEGRRPRPSYGSGYPPVYPQCAHWQRVRAHRAFTACGVLPPQGVPQGQRLFLENMRTNRLNWDPGRVPQDIADILRKGDITEDVSLWLAETPSEVVLRLRLRHPLKREPPCRC